MRKNFLMGLLIGCLVSGVFSAAWTIAAGENEAGGGLAAKAKEAAKKRAEQEAQAENDAEGVEGLSKEDGGKQQEKVVVEDG